MSVGGGATSPTSTLGLAVGCKLSAVSATLATKLGMRLPAAEVGSALPAALHAQHDCQHMFDTHGKRDRNIHLLLIVTVHLHVLSNGLSKCMKLAKFILAKATEQHKKEVPDSEIAANCRV